MLAEDPDRPEPIWRKQFSASIKLVDLSLRETDQCTLLLKGGPSDIPTGARDEM
jgi:hypothetical protein